jgi:integrase
MKLSQPIVDALVCPPGKKEALIVDDGQLGLCIRVFASGAKTYYADTKGGRVKLGACSALKLAQARNAARAVAGDVAHGKDPIAERKEAAHRTRAKEAQDKRTLRVLVDRWTSAGSAGKRPRYVAQTLRTLKRVFKDQLDLPVARLDRETVMDVLDGLVEAGSPVMARRAGSYLSACCAWAVARGTLKENRFAKLPLANSKKRQRTLDDEELHAVWKASENMGPYGAIVRTLIATGARRDEVARMPRRGELAPDLSTWTIPGERAKNHVDLILPLPALAKEIIAAQAQLDDNPYVFPGQGGPYGGFSQAKARLDKASGVTGWTLHDLRRTFATNMQKLGIRLEVTESLLNHVSGSRAGIVEVYQRHDFAPEKVTAMEAWDRRLREILAGSSAADNVVGWRKEL